MRFSAVVLLIALCAAPSSLILASQDTQTAKPNTKPLTNADVLDMLKAGLSQEIVVAKINASACEFDTSPAALKALKSANVPDAIILAMVKARLIRKAILKREKIEAASATKFFRDPQKRTPT